MNHEILTSPCLPPPVIPRRKSAGPWAGRVQMADSVADHVINPAVGKRIECLTDQAMGDLDDI